MAIDVGQVYEATYDLVDANGAATNAAGVTLTVTLPDQTPDTPAVANPPATTGHYICNYPTTQVGLHRFHWTTTGPVTAKDDWVDVRQFTSIVSIADAKAHLNLTATTDDEEVRSFLEAATRLVEAKVGPCVRQTVTEVVRGGTMVTLSKFPILAVTSAAPAVTGGVAYDVTTWDFNPATGVLWRKDGGFITGPQRIVYIAGRAVIPPNFTLAAKIILQHLWRTQRGNAGIRTGGGDETLMWGMGFGIPNSALELLQPDTVPGIA